MSFYGEKMSKRDIMAGIDHDPKSSKIVSRNTVRYTHNGHVCYRLYRTTIYEEVEGGVILRTNGWNSILTKDRLNLALKNEKSEMRVWRMGRYGSHNMMLVREGQIVPILGSIDTSRPLEEAKAPWADDIMRKYNLWWTHNVGQTKHPKDVEWDGRASTLRWLIMKDHCLPWRILEYLPGTKLQLVQEERYRWRPSATLTLRYKFINNKIRIRNLIDEVLEAGHIDKIERRKNE